MARRLAGVILITGFIGGCCNCLKPLPPANTALPPPITLEQQLAELNARAAQLPRFKATADSSGVEVIIPDENGKPHHEPAAEGVLLLEQKYATHTANVLLVVRYLDKDIFELGKNEQQWWAIERDKKPAAQTGAVKPVVDFDPDSQETVFPLLADAIPELLGITEIVPNSEQTIYMRVDDERGVNDVAILRPNPDGTATIDREIIVDRRSGEVREVDLYWPDGRLMVRSTLDHYKPVTLAGNAAADAPKMPRSIIVDYPAKQSRLGLRLVKVDVPASFPDDQFTPPDWNDEGITPQVVK